MGGKILVSAGHSTGEGGAPGASSNGYTEANETLRVRDAVAAILKDKDLTVITDGEEGVSESLRSAIALAREADVAVEFHFNSSSSNRATGIEVLARANNRTLPRNLAKAIEQATRLTLRGGDGGYKPDNSGQHASLGFCRAGGLVVEICFISNPSDMSAYEANFSTLSTKLADVVAVA